ncbi:hypothetical protein K503DRAFT_387947 [Rhizopogon vinicolor AM-OR11-026]|uniref:Uncharacterized protein n=1 Tax=Rhizopogon vinicolor AM-OR11-026 TaxID=1314800 RepID=A0A1B7NBP4_9AGAM|nr:hypothetical protein K503DRAFT_387947 [Rhizopogon vinicolor AM-OR11-026]
MVQRQRDKWPFQESKKRFTSKTNMLQMHAVFLNPVHGFTKPVPRATATETTMQPGDAGAAGGPRQRHSPLPASPASWPPCHRLCYLVTRILWGLSWMMMPRCRGTWIWAGGTLIHWQLQITCLAKPWAGQSARTA